MSRTRTVAGALMLAVALLGSAQAADFKLTSKTVKSGGTIANEQVYNGFGCSGGNVSPDLGWSGAPARTRSFALTVYDPDAPGSGFWHWVVVNMPPDTKELPKGAGKPGASGLPAGALQTRTDFGAPGYGGPCPPKGDRPHRYQFTVYAVDLPKLDVTADTSAAAVGSALQSHMLGKATFTATYSR